MDNVIIFLILVAFMSFTQFIGIVLYVRFDRFCKKIKTMLYAAAQKPTAEEHTSRSDLKSDYEMDDI